MNEIISVPDDKYVLDLFSTALQHEGYQVVWADELQKIIDKPQGKNPELLITNGNGKVFMLCWRLIE